MILKQDNRFHTENLANYFCHWSDAIIFKNGEWKSLKYKLHKTLRAKYYTDPGRILGVRFGSQTKYLAADIDRASSIHPASNPIGFGKFLKAMEKIGLVRHTKLQSSWSEGLHIYFSLPKAVNTFDAACLMRWAVLRSGLIIAPGHLELFPNTKSYVPYDPKNPKQKFSLYNGLRLPCQPGTGSFVLDDDFNPVSDRLDTFLSWAQQDAAGQDWEKFKRYLRSARSKLKKVEKQITKKLSANATDWKEDLEEIIATAWTGHGQTNDLISNIVRYAIVFMGKTGESLRAWVKQVAINSPGYERWCRHRHEIDRKIEHWCRSTENHKRYLPYLNFPNKTPLREIHDDGLKEKNKNELKAEAASKRIIHTVEKLKSEGNYPDGAVARTEAIATASQELFGAQISKSTLRKRDNLPLWHPKHETQISREVSYTLDPKMTKNDRDESYTESEVSYTLPPMKCVRPAEEGGQISVEQAPPKLASLPVDSQPNSPLPPKFSQQLSRSGAGLALDPLHSGGHEGQTRANSGRTRAKSGDKPSTKILSSALASFGEVLKVKQKLEKKIDALAVEEIERKYPRQKFVPKSDRIAIESVIRARLYWESGIPRLMERSEQIWDELDDW